MKIYNERHEVRDYNKYNAIYNSMLQDGWQGAPLIAVSTDGEDYQLLNGSHRVAAARDSETDLLTLDYSVSQDIYDALVASCDDDEIETILIENNLVDILQAFKK